MKASHRWFWGRTTGARTNRRNGDNPYNKSMTQYNNQKGSIMVPYNNLIQQSKMAKQNKEREYERVNSK
jgi:hypothetical protein